MTETNNETSKNEISVTTFDPVNELGSEETLYQILNVAPDATRLEIRESFLRLKGTYTAGNAALYSLISEEESNESLVVIEEAYRTLNDAVSRRQYDLQMGFGVINEPLPGITNRTNQYGASTSFDGDRSDPLSYIPPQTNDFSSNPYGQESETASQYRPKLPIVKTKAFKAGSETLSQEFTRLIEESDPSDGDLYRKLREAAEVSKEELQIRTKVSLCYISDIEANRFDRLPQLVYVKGFLRCIFKYLGVSESDKLVTAYAQRFEEWLTPKTN